MTRGDTCWRFLDHISVNLSGPLTHVHSGALTVPPDVVISSCPEGSDDPPQSRSSSDIQKSAGDPHQKGRHLSALPASLGSCLNPN